MSAKNKKLFFVILILLSFNYGCRSHSSQWTLSEINIKNEKEIKSRNYYIRYAKFQSSAKDKNGNKVQNEKHLDDSEVSFIRKLLTPIENHKDKNDYFSEVNKFLREELMYLDPLLPECYMSKEKSASFLNNDELTSLLKNIDSFELLQNNITGNPQSEKYFGKGLNLESKYTASTKNLFLRANGIYNIQGKNDLTTSESLIMKYLTDGFEDDFVCTTPYQIDFSMGERNISIKEDQGGKYKIISDFFGFQESYYFSETNKIHAHHNLTTKLENFNKPEHFGIPIEFKIHFKTGKEQILSRLSVVLNEKIKKEKDQSEKDRMKKILEKILNNNLEKEEDKQLIEMIDELVKYIGIANSKKYYFTYWSKAQNNFIISNDYNYDYDENYALFKESINKKERGYTDLLYVTDDVKMQEFKRRLIEKESEFEKDMERYRFYSSFPDFDMEGQRNLKKREKESAKALQELVKKLQKQEEDEKREANFKKKEEEQRRELERQRRAEAEARKQRRELERQRRAEAEARKQRRELERQRRVEAEAREQRRRLDEKNRRCSHVYVGKVFSITERGSISLFDFDMKYKVMGFSRGTERVTITGLDAYNAGTSEVSCSFVPR